MQPGRALENIPNSEFSEKVIENNGKVIHRKRKVYTKNYEMTMKSYKEKAQNLSSMLSFLILGKLVKNYLK